MSVFDVLLSLLAAAVPAGLVFVLMARRERVQRGHSRLLTRGFVVGLIVVFPAVIPVVLFRSTAAAPGADGSLLLRAFVLSAATEELAKFLAIRFFLMPSDHFTRAADGVRGGVACGLGFGIVENVIYSLGVPELALIRSISAAPLHAGTAGIIGYAVGRNAFQPGFPLLVGFLPALVLHGAYNLIVIGGVARGIPALVVAGLAPVIAVVLAADARRRDEQADRR